jgi:sigma-B regulation protein RsbU (phosphoserine phosphatase)
MSDSPTRTSPDAIDEALIRLKDRALSASAEGITIADARLPDRPLIYVNAGFEKLTGYSRDEVLGRNCRFLQGAGTEADTVTEIRNAVNDGRECTVEILNYRKDGSPFWNRLAITPVEDDSGEITHFIGIQSDVSARRRAEDELRQAKLDLEEALQELQQDLDLAAKVQRSLLPTRSPNIERLNAAWEFIPSAHLAGDFLNIFALDERHAAMYVLDVSGHGASAALLSVTLSRWLSPLPSDSRLMQPDQESATGYRVTPPAEVLAYLNSRYRPTAGLAQYFTMVYGVVDAETRQFTYAAAGHPGPIQVSSAGSSVAHSSTGLPIGMFPDVEYRQQVVSLQPGDRIWLYTDGVTEAVDADGNEFGGQRLLDAVVETCDLALDQALQRILGNVRDWQSAKLGLDDLSLLAAEID